MNDELTHKISDDPVEASIGYCKRCKESIPSNRREEFCPIKDETRLFSVLIGLLRFIDPNDPAPMDEASMGRRIYQAKDFIAGRSTVEEDFPHFFNDKKEQP